ncbi:MAG TPA: penicillin-binding protein 2 [Stellaceae bacterium]|jgi:cell division protein FtsI (penicillin-binding protein 3)|nr:penicillin-binding protein 2 [Stellaceae bacterium]
MTAAPPRDPNPCRPRHFRPGPCGPEPQDGPAKQWIETSRTRLIIAGALMGLAFVVIAARLVEVSGLKAGDRVAHGSAPAHIEASRANIVDRNGVLLATTLTTPSLYADPKQILDARAAARKLAQVLPDLTEADIYAKLTSDKSFVWLKRQLTPRQMAAINALGIPGLDFQDEDKRIYPQGRTFAHVVGYAGLDNKGLAGIERSFDDDLRSRHGPLQLSVDLRVQAILRGEIARQMTEFKAIGGSGIIMNVRTGEVVALVSLPDFDPNEPGATPTDNLFNRVTLGTYEIGSVFKIFTVAMALDDRVTTLAGGYDASHPIEIGRFTIHDDHAQNRWLSVPEIFMYSSNIGAAKMAVDVGADRQRDFLGKLGLLTTPSFELPEIGAPLVPSAWRPVNVMTIGFGHGISISPLQIATAVSAVVNGGTLHRATIVKPAPDASPAGHQVLSEATSIEMRKLLRLVVEKGTGKLAEAPGYLVGGKTGTAEKVSGKSYNTHSLISSFAGVFPVNDPRYFIMISIDEPHGDKQSSGYATGGWVAAPGVSRTIERTASILGIQPVDEDSPEIRRSLVIGLPSPSGRKFASN